MEKKSITPGQRKQIVRLLEDGFGKISLGRNAAQEIIKRGDVLQSDFTELVYKLSRFAHEEMESSYGYPEGYKVKGITEQTNILRRLFPGVGFADERIARQSLPDGAEGWFAIPKWQTFAPTYGHAVEKVIAKIAYTRKFCNLAKSHDFEAERLRQCVRTAKLSQILNYKQKDYDILVVPAQFGLVSTRAVRCAGLALFSPIMNLVSEPSLSVLCC